MPDLKVPTAVIAISFAEGLADHRERTKNWKSEEVNVKAAELTDPVLKDLLDASRAVGDTSFARTVGSIIAARGGEMKKIPNYRAAPALITSYLQSNLIDGWLYERGSDGHMHPRLVTGVYIEEPHGYQDEPRIVIKMTSDHPFISGSSRSDSRGTVSSSISLAKGEVTRKTPADVLINAGYIRETEELKEAYLERLTRFEDVMSTGFAEQFRFTGTPQSDDRWKTENPVTDRKVVMDIKTRELNALRGTVLSSLGKNTDGEDDGGLLPVPVETVTRVFDLKGHKFWTVNVNDLTDYEYDESLRDKLILPDDQRELLDVLTTDLGAFSADIVEGKSAGNVVLAKGKPGVGKTLTAEVYAEIVKRPLYSIHSGVLGISADSVRKNLEEAFDRAQRWNAVMLLDEADVFVLERGRDISQNAITAEFLRTLEYFDGLLFMTTNRSDDIDDAIISRCAALIDYRTPGKDNAVKIWRVLAKQMGANDELTPKLLDQLVRGLPNAAPRDMKMLLRLTLRMARSKNQKLSLELFAKCAMFRGLHLDSNA